MSLTMLDWLDTSKLMFQQLLPGPVDVFTGQNIAPDTFAATVSQEAHKVDHALTTMALAKDEQVVFALVKQLGHNTLMALFSRWAHYHQGWQSLPAGAPHWIPQTQQELWRAIFLSMTTEGLYSSKAAAQLWPDVFAK